ncbi:fibrinogen alpha chain [Hypanus sabinus]|uniref:fibrinogen alpha chain n=1 Tax=Hypanus sabinus TaxID=79690 RepID=UPI0028C37BE0|nr:fibrinogen alpha chain [Hypanus sabinus]
MRAAQVFGLFVCFILFDWVKLQSEASLTAGRAQPGEMVDVQSECTEKWLICTDDNWGSKCPSGCRMQRLIDVKNQQNDERIQEMQHMLKNYSKMFGGTDITVAKVVNRIRQSLDGLGEFGDTYYQLVDDMNSKLISLQYKINNQSVKLRLLKKRVLKQFRSITGFEIDIALKMRSCKGSCNMPFIYNINSEHNAQMEKSVNSLNSMRLDSIVYNKPIHKLSLVKKFNAVTGFKSDFNLKYPKFWEEVPVGLFSLSDDSPPTSFDMSTGSASKDLNVDTDIIANGNVSDTLSGINSTRRENTLLNHGINSTRNSNASLTHVHAAVSSEKQYLTKSSVKGNFSGSSNFTELFHSLSGSQSVLQQNISKITNSVNFSNPSFRSLEQIGLEKTMLPQESKHVPGNSTYVKTSDFNDYSDSKDADSSKLIESREHAIFSTKEVTEFKDNAPCIETCNSNYQFTYMEDSNTMYPSVNRSLFFDEGVAEYVPDVHVHNLNVETMHKITNYIGKDCDDIMQKHAKGHENGLFKIKPTGCPDILTVYCDQSTGVGGWMLVQQRMDESENFNRSWDEYRRGFGSLDDQGEGNIWLGNDILHILTQKETFLRIELEDWSGNKKHAEYIANISSESENYMLNITSYTGDAGDALITGLAVDGAYISHVNMKFSTFDRDNDKWEENCAQFYGGGWWYNNCQAANLNGIYYHGGPYDPRDNVPYEIENGVVWAPFKGIDYSLKVVKMKIRPDTSV